MYYPEEVIEEVRMRSDIVDVISGYVKLQKKGSNLFGLCPFHHEKSPSFSVSPSKQMYHCFGCGVSGNVITFVMEYENYSFREAVEMLADRSGVKLPKMEYSEEAKAKADRKAALLEINKLAANYFYYQLKQPQGKIGYDYLVKRKLTDETIRRFGLGFSNKIRDDLYRYLKSKGYEDELLKDTGLVTIEERGARDKFWNRVMFPIMDVNSRVIGFGGRVLGDGEPKYLNSPETMLFDKSRNLYGLNYARTSRKKYMMLCEGYTFGSDGSRADFLCGRTGAFDETGCVRRFSERGEGRHADGDRNCADLNRADGGGRCAAVIGISGGFWKAARNGAGTGEDSFCPGAARGCAPLFQQCGGEFAAGSLQRGGV